MQKKKKKKKSGYKESKILKIMQNYQTEKKDINKNYWKADVANKKKIISSDFQWIQYIIKM